MSSNGMVLVHGGFHCARCWSLVLPHLNLPAVAVDLPGRGNRPADLDTVTLQDCVSAVIDAADAAGFDRVTLVGHSIGGVTITETAYQHPERINHLVYVAGLVPPAGGSVSVVMAGREFPAGTMAMIDEPVAKELFGTGLDEQQWAQCWATCVPETAAMLNARLSGYPTDVPVSYVSMTDDVPVPPDLAEQMIVNIGGHVDHRVLATGHSAMFSKPIELAEILNSVADNQN